MDSVVYDSTASIQQLLDRGFELPIHFAAVGTNGSVVAGTFSHSGAERRLNCQITVRRMKRDGLAGPVNILYVDRKGESAVVTLRPAGEDEGDTACRA